MDHKQYQTAFSRLEPSQAAIDAALSRDKPRKPRRSARAGSVLLAAALTVSLLAGAVFAAVHFQWFDLGGAERIVQPERSDTEAFGKEESLQLAPENLITLNGAASETYIGFTLPASYLDGQDTRNCWMLGDGLYRRYYRNPDPSDPDSPLLTVEIVYDAAYLTRYASEVVKEEALNGIQTVWLLLSSSADGRAQYCLFQRNDDLGCFAVIASTEGFEAAEQAAADLRFEDSGIPISQAEPEVVYGFHLAWMPDDMTLDSRTVMEDRWYLANATLQDETQELSEILLGCNWVSEASSCNIGVSVAEGLADIAPIEYGTVLKTGKISGRTARWVRGKNGNLFIEVKFPEEQVQLLACISVFGADAESGAFAEERFAEVAERLLESAELIPVVIAAPAPADFYPFSVG